MKHFSLFLLSLFLLPAASHAATDSTALVWSDPTLWYEGSARTMQADDSRPDVFYLLPTCVSAWTDADGLRHVNADPFRTDHRAAWKLSAELADSIFATRANLFLPYYRQATFEGLEGAAAAEAIERAERDAWDAFSYYLTHLNHGRRFILAGYSQGGQMVKFLLNRMADSTFHRLIAAYIVGNGVTPADTATHAPNAFSHIRLATDETSQGVTVVFNSVTDTAAICPLLCAGNIACINPLSWTVSSTPAVLVPSSASAAKGPSLTDDPRFPYATAPHPRSASVPVMVAVDSVHHVLLVGGLDPKRYFFPPLAHFFPEGNLHLQELFFYAPFLRRNVLVRSGE